MQQRIILKEPWTASLDSLFAVPVTHTFPAGTLIIRTERKCEASVWRTWHGRHGSLPIWRVYEPDDCDGSDWSLFVSSIPGPGLVKRLT